MDETIPPTPFADNVDISIHEAAESLASNAMTSQVLESIETQGLTGKILTAIFLVAKDAAATVILEKKPLQGIKGRGEMIPPIQPKKKKRKARNEIDDIFGS